MTKNSNLTEHQRFQLEQEIQNRTKDLQNKIDELKAQLKQQKEKYETEIQTQSTEFQFIIKEQQNQIEQQKLKYEQKLKSKAKELEELQVRNEELQEENNFLRNNKTSLQHKDEIEPPKRDDFEILDEETINTFEKEEEIGSGGSGRVFKVIHKEIRALKEMINTKAKISNFKNFIKEYEIMNMLQHPNILKTYGIFLSNEKIPVSILFEYCPLNLATAIENEIFNDEQITAIIYQIVEGMKYVHFNHIIHRDLKPTNILIASNGTIKIGDFGISKIMTVEQQTTMTLGIGTQKFMAPEIINEEDHYDEKVDVYSFGTVLYFILSGGELPKIKIFDMAKRKKAPIPSEFTKFSQDLINDCWNFDPDDRPSFGQILQRIEESCFNLIELTRSEVKKVEAFVKQHKAGIPKYE